MGVDGQLISKVLRARPEKFNKMLKVSHRLQAVRGKLQRVMIDYLHTAVGECHR